MVPCFQCVIVHYINVLEIVVSRVICPQDVHILISGTVIAYLACKRDFTDVIK